jgi:hypothetical protein
MFAYASEGGVSFKTVLPRYLYLSTWGLSGLYVVADIGIRVHEAPEASKLRVGVDWTIFHTAASMVVPGVVIHYIREAAAKGVAAIPKMPPAGHRWLPALFAVASVPFIVHPIDHGTGTAAVARGHVSRRVRCRARCATPTHLCVTRVRPVPSDTRRPSLTCASLCHAEWVMDRAVRPYLDILGPAPPSAHGDGDKISE